MTLEAILQYLVVYGLENIHWYINFFNNTEKIITFDFWRNNNFDLSNFGLSCECRTKFMAVCQLVHQRFESQFSTPLLVVFFALTCKNLNGLRFVFFPFFRFILPTLFSQSILQRLWKPHSVENCRNNEMWVMIDLYLVGENFIR